MIHRGHAALTALAILSASPPARGAPCDRLSAEQGKQARALMASIHPYACCDEDLLRCLQARQVCKLARRLRDDVCRRVARGQDAKGIRAAMDSRARSAAGVGQAATFDLSRAVPAGDPTAKVAVVIYACARCPFCSKVVPDLYRKVVSGPLKGKARLYLLPFPIRGHAGSVEGAMAMLAARQQKKFWPLVLHLYQNFDRFSAAALEGWAKALGLDPAAFRRDLAAAPLRQELVASKKEGLRNGVSATPTIFISGRKYHGDMDPETLLDVLEEEADRLAGRQFCDAAAERTSP